MALLLRDAAIVLDGLLDPGEELSRLRVRASLLRAMARRRRVLEDHSSVRQCIPVSGRIWRLLLQIYAELVDRRARESMRRMDLGIRGTEE